MELGGVDSTCKSKLPLCEDQAGEVTADLGPLPPGLSTSRCILYLHRMSVFWVSVESEFQGGGSQDKNDIIEIYTPKPLL